MITVSVIYDYVIERVYVFLDRDVSIAEECFLHNCEVSLTGWDKYTNEEITDMLDSGFAYDSERSVCLSHAIPYEENTGLTYEITHRE